MQTLILLPLQNLLLLADVLGPAVPQPHSRPVSPPPVGRVEVLRRRVTRDGRVKLKLRLLGVAVDRCAICMSQFKEGQMAGLARCQHS